MGMVAIAAQYRLTNEHDITAIESMSDARDLIMWMRLHSDSLNIEPDSVAAYGWSAGAHLVSSAAVFGAKTTVSSANPVEHIREGLQLFHDQMVAHGNHCELYVYDGVGHLFTPNTMPDNREPHAM